MDLILFENFSKKENSTKRPEGGEVFNIVLKQPTSILNPSFLIEADFKNYTYAVFNGMYYFVSDITISTNNLLNISCNIDAMATCKEYIANTKAFINYSKISSDIVDHRLPTITSQKSAESVIDFPISYNSTGSYLLSVFGLDSSVAVYSLTRAKLSQLTNALSDWLSTTLDSGDLNTIVCNIFGAGNTDNCLRQCLWVPFPAFTGDAEIICLGTFDTGISAVRVDNIPPLVYNTSITIPWAFNDWRDSLSFVSLYIPYIGVIPFSGSALRGEKNIRIRISRCVIDGSFSVQLGAGNVELGTYTAETCTDYPIGVTRRDVGGMVRGAVMSVSGVTTGNMSLGASGAGEFLSSLQPVTSIVGSLYGQNATELYKKIMCSVRYYATTESPTNAIDVRGVPTAKTLLIGDIGGGYIQCSNASIDAPFIDPIRTMVNSYLNGGFYYE